MLLLSPRNSRLQVFLDLLDREWRRKRASKGASGLESAHSRLSACLSVREGERCVTCVPDMAAGFGLGVGRVAHSEQLQTALTDFEACYVRLWQLMTEVRAIRSEL